MRVPEPVPELSAILHTPGGLRWRHVPLSGQLSSAVLVKEPRENLVQNVVLLTKERGEEEARKEDLGQPKTWGITFKCTTWL